MPGRNSSFHRLVLSPGAVQRTGSNPRGCGGKGLGGAFAFSSRKQGGFTGVGLPWDFLWLAFCVLPCPRGLDVPMDLCLFSFWLVPQHHSGIP